MKSTTSARFRQHFRRLPPLIRRQVRRAYERFKNDPYHPSLHFKRVSSSLPLYSARVNLDYRVLGLRDKDEIIWIWIGPHDEYDKILAQYLR